MSTFPTSSYPLNSHALMQVCALATLLALPLLVERAGHYSILEVLLVARLVVVMIVVLVVTSRARAARPVV